MSELPDAARKVLEDAFPQGNTVAVHQVVKGKDVGQYDAYLRCDGRLYEVEVSSEGTIIEKKEVVSRTTDSSTSRDRRTTSHKRRRGVRVVVGEGDERSKDLHKQ